MITSDKSINPHVGLREGGALFFVGAMTLVILSQIAIAPVLEGGLRLGAIAVSFVGAALTCWHVLRLLRLRFALRLVRPLADAARGPVFVSDSHGQILHRNRAAKSGLRNGTLSEALSDMIAAPELLCDRLRNHALANGQANDDVATRRGVISIRVLRIAPDLLHWQIEAADEARAPDGEVMKLPMLVLTRTGAISYCNPAAADLIGTRPSHVSAIFGEKSPQPGQVQRIPTASGPRDVLVSEFSDGSAQRQLYLLPDPDGARHEQVDSGWDMVEDLPVPLLKIALGGEVLSANRGARELLRSDLPPGTRLADLLDGLGRPFADWLKEAYRSPGGAQPQFLRGAGENRDRVVQVALRKSRSGEIPHLVGVLHNATEFKQLEAQFVQSQKMQAIGQLAGGVAHDFNNLLTAIAGHCDLLLLRHEQNDPDFPDLTQIRQNADRAAGLVGQLLAFSRKQDLQLEPLDLRDTLADLTHLLNRLVGERVALTLVHDPAPLSVLADKSQFEQVIMNLVVNARDAMDGAGEVRIEAETLHLTKPLMRDRATVQPGDYVVVRVVDHGCGIPPEMMSHVFEPFYTTKGVGEGTGLGLSTAYGIVKQLGGFIFLDSMPNEGTTFAVYLPMHEEAAPEMPVKKAAPMKQSHSGGVVLLVEDEAPVRAFAARALRLRGYEVIEAETGESALAQLAEEETQVDLFVTDVVMPGMDGPTWVREAMKARPEARVIFVSGYSEDSLRENRNHIPNSVFLPKPFSLADLIATVDSQIGADKAAAE